MAFSWAAVAAFAFIFTFYHVANAVMQIAFYACRRGDAGAWKLQPDKVGSLTPAAWWLWIPACSRKPGRHPLAPVLATVNTLIASLAAGAVAEASVRGLTKLYAPLWAVPAGGWSEWGRIALDFCLAVAWENVAEYYWHRAMHWRLLYAWAHKLHHANKAPEPFDDMLIHPLEAVGYYCILYSPPFLFRLHTHAFLAYMALMGTCGVLDHCGVRIHVPGACPRGGGVGGLSGGARAQRRSPPPVPPCRHLQHRRPRPAPPGVPRQLRLPVPVAGHPARHVRRGAVWPQVPRPGRPPGAGIVLGGVRAARQRGHGACGRSRSW
jgi:sterol desaturase/sphingolipid hydroxylase (fatty acid hydroxylase superfamily)